VIEHFNIDPMDYIDTEEIIRHRNWIPAFAGMTPSFNCWIWYCKISSNLTLSLSKGGVILIIRRFVSSPFDKLRVRTVLMAQGEGSVNSSRSRERAVLTAALVVRQAHP